MGLSGVSAPPYTPANSQIVTRSAQYMLSSNGWRCPSQRYTPGASALFGVGQKTFISDDYWTFAPRFLLPNWYLTTSGAGGQEAANGNNITIQAVSLIVGLGGTPVQLTVNGSASSYTLVDDTEIWTDAPSAFIAIPPRTKCFLRVAWAVPDAVSTLCAPYPGIRPVFGDLAEVSATTLASKVMAGGIATSLPSGNSQYFYSAAGMVAQGWDGRPVGLGFGTSIEAGAGQSRLSCGASGAIGPIERGMMSGAGNAPRYAFTNWSVSGGLAAGIIGTGANQGLTRRIRAIAALGLSYTPFTFTYSGFGTNDQTATLATWQTSMTAMWAAIKSAWPTCRFIQSTLWPRTTSTDGFSTVANQTLSSNWTYPTGSAWGLYEWMLGNNPSAQAVDAMIDVENFIDNQLAGGTRGKWRVDLTTTGWTTTTTSNTTAGTTSAALASLPRAGTILSFLDGTNEAIIVALVSGTASPFTLTTSTTFVNAHTSGGAVSEAASTSDGVHPGDVIAAYVGDQCYAPAKLAGVFG